MLCEIFSQTGANSRVLETDSDDMIDRDHECYFQHAAKDSGIAIDIAEESGIHVPLAKATLAQYQKMVEHGLGELDKSGIAELTFKGEDIRTSPECISLMNPWTFQWGIFLRF